MRTAIQGTVAQMLQVYDLILLLKVARDGACLTSSSRLFQSLGPRKDIALCPLLVFRKGIERSVSVFLSSLTFRADLFSNKLERYSGTRPFSDLYTVVAVSPLMMSQTVGQYKLCIKPIEGVISLLYWMFQRRVYHERKSRIPSSGIQKAIRKSFENPWNLKNPTSTWKISRNPMTSLEIRRNFLSL